MLNPILNKLNSSTAFSETHNLFLFPGNNQYIYMAYLDKVLRHNGESLPASALLAFLRDSYVKGKPGLFKRAPYGGPPNSHDEIMGVFSMLSDNVEGHDESMETHQSFNNLELIYNYLNSNFGYFNSNNMPGFFRFFRYNVFRMYWLRPYLKACLGLHKLSLLDQALWSLKLKLNEEKDSNTAITGPGARLRNWLMAHEMVKYPMCARAWKSYTRLLDLKGITVAHDLHQEPGVQILVDYAPKGYELA